VQAPEPTLAETLQRICGSVEVAKDLLERSGDLYLSQSQARDHHVIECFVRAVAVLGEIGEALEGQLEGSFGPAA
jgi:hypothetical protein